VEEILVLDFDVPVLMLISQLVSDFMFRFG
jgi:hypothetical protein